ncbi:hypothetical protein A2U01_0004726 [Trifolium medium]|uniref:Uncharacterized protein n=1 Tax=Trifolium medium TaxID=97028 RepID=A0A392MAR6_9FABA|nr:hypothetical protein [Trifolium medium]
MTCHLAKLLSPYGVAVSPTIGGVATPLTVISKIYKEVDLLLLRSHSDGKEKQPAMLQTRKTTASKVSSHQ